MSRRSRVSLLLLASFVLLVLDQLTKLWAYNVLTPGHSIALSGPIDLTLVFNRSNAFGIAPDMGEATRWLLLVLNLAVVSALAYFIWTREEPRTALLGSSFIIAGGIGNAIDRIWLGAVIDMFDASEIGFIWVFNAADVFIDIGVGLWLLGILFSKSDHRPSEAVSSGLQP